MNKVEGNITGKGWSFPPRFDKANQELITVTGVKDIEESLRILFGTRKGERVLEPDFGCNISDVIFRNMGLSEKTSLKNRITQAIYQYEARISLNQIEIDSSQIGNGICYILIDFTIESTNNRRNIVFPFFLEEGSLVPDDYAI